MEEKKYPIVGYAPGNYQCKCCDCGESFLGDKRAVQCEPCAIATKEKFDGLSPEEQKELMESNAEAIREVFSIGGKKCNCNEPYDSEKHGGGYPRCPVHDKAIEIPRQIGTALPTDEQVSTWFEENIDKECSASSAIYKFRQWLKSLRAEQKRGPVWVKASEYDISKGGMLFYRFDGPTLKSIGIGHFVGDLFYGVNLDVFPMWDWKYLYILDESAPSGERDPYAGFRETIENIIHSAGKHNQEQCTEIADAILRDLSIGLCCQKKKSPSGEREGDAVAFNIHCTDSYYYENGFWWHKENHDPYSVDQLYDIFKQQNGNNENS